MVVVDVAGSLDVVGVVAVVVVDAGMVTGTVTGAVVGAVVEESGVVLVGA